MKVAMMGSGGVGGFFGGRLVKAGCDVSFIARGRHLEALRRDGLTIENEPQGDIHIPKVHATDAMGDHASTAAQERVTGVPTVAAGRDSPEARGAWVSRLRVSRT